MADNITPKDLILLFFYARRRPVKGRIRQQHEIFLAIKIVFNNTAICPAVSFEKRRSGPYSGHVEDALNELGFSNFLAITGKKSSNDFAVTISFNGMNYIKDKFNALSEKTKNDLELLRAQLEAHTRDGVLNIIRTHFSKYINVPDTDIHGSVPDWHNDVQTLYKK